MATAHDAQAPIEKDFNNNNGYTNGNNNGAYHMSDTTMDNDTALKRIRTAGSISISPELFEKIYLSPQNAVKGDLRKTFGNPTPLALAGFLLSLSPLSCILLGWRGSGGLGASGIGSYFFFGGLLMIVGGFLEFLLGNTFPFVVFMTFGAFWLTFGSTLQPFYGAVGSFAPPGEPTSAGLENPQFYASFAFFLLFMGVLCLIYFVCSLRTNVIFVLIFLCLVPAFSLLAATFWKTAQALGGDAAAAGVASKCQTAAGSLVFVVCMLGWYLFFVIMLAGLDFPIQLPVGDLSTMIKGASEKAKAKENMV